MAEEKDSLDANQTMEHVQRVPGMKVIPVHWIYSLKADSQGKGDQLQGMTCGTRVSTSHWG
jgi:hypothetical protein